MTAAHKRHREMLHDVYAARKESIQRRLSEFSRIPRKQYPYELLYCLLTPQSSARNAGAVVQQLQARNFLRRPFDPEPLLRDPEHYIRFHRTKARRLLQLVDTFTGIDSILDSALSAMELRDWLVEHVDGLGMKEATHFLRNIGRNDCLAILDRHILRHLVLSGVLAEVPSSVTRNTYLVIEKKFKRFSDTMQIPIDELDLLFWSLQTGEILK